MRSRGEGLFVGCGYATTPRDGRSRLRRAAEKHQARGQARGLVAPGEDRPRRAPKPDTRLMARWVIRTRTLRCLTNEVTRWLFGAV